MINWSIFISYELIFLQLLIPLKSNLHLSFFVFQSRGISFNPKKIKHIFGHRACLQVKGVFVFLKKVTIQEKPPFFFWCAHWFHSKYTQCKIAKKAQITPHKKITIKIKGHQDNGRVLFSSSLFLGSIKNDCFN